MHFENDTIVCTPEHPFFVNNTWREARDLKKGDKLFAYDGKKIAIDSIYTFRTDTATKVYNFEVAGNNDYYVGSTRVLVHNKAMKAPEGSFQKMGKAIKNMTGNRAVGKAQIDNLVNKYKLSKGQRELLHNYIGKQGYGYHEIEEIIKNGWYK